MNSGEQSTSASTELHSAASAVAKPKKPRLALFLATACGLGYIPVAPGTFGSLAGIVVALIPFQILQALGKTGVQSFVFGSFAVDPLLVTQIVGAVLVALIGVVVSSYSAQHWKAKDPQRVVIDEVSGQHLTLLLGTALPVWATHAGQSWAPTALGFITYQSVLSWKYLLLGFILFRVFDIWKPFPARQAESLRGGWGIMTDDWIAAIFAGLCLWATRVFGL
jgi:phosphatidylglycerophosphatase A